MKSNTLMLFRPAFSWMVLKVAGANGSPVLNFPRPTVVLKVKMFRESGLVQTKEPTTRGSSDGSINTSFPRARMTRAVYCGVNLEVTERPVCVNGPPQLNELLRVSKGVRIVSSLSLETGVRKRP